MKTPCLVDNNTIKQVAVVSASAMGSQIIALVCAIAGYQVTSQDIKQQSIDKATTLLDGQIDRRVEKGRFTREEVDGAFSRLTF